MGPGHIEWGVGPSKSSGHYQVSVNTYGWSQVWVVIDMTGMGGHRYGWSQVWVVIDMGGHRYGWS